MTHNQAPMTNREEDDDHRIRGNPLIDVPSLFCPPIPSLVIGIWLLVVLSYSAAAADGPPEESASVADLIAGLDDEDPACRCSSIAALADRGTMALPAVAVLTHALADKNGDIRAAAAKTLGRLALEPDRVIPALFAALADETPSDEGPVWMVAARALGKYGESAVPSLIKALEDERLHVRRAAMLGIVTAGPKAKDAVPALIGILEENDPNTRNFVSNALIRIGPDSRAAVPVLIKRLSCDDFHTQYWACRALGAIGPDAKPATPKLVQLIDSGVTSVRRNAAAALGNIGPAVGEKAVAALIKTLSDYSQPVRQQALIALGKLGPLAAPAIPPIEQGLQEPLAFKPAANAARTLWLLKPDPEIPARALLAELEAGDEPWAAAHVLGEIGVELGVFDEVAETLKSDNREARLYAAVALGEIGPKAANARPALERALDDEDEEVREAAEEALERIKGGGEELR